MRTGIPIILGTALPFKVTHNFRSFRRVYTTLIEEHFESNKQMLFLSGPFQVGKTTLSVSLKKDFHYFNWDDQNDRQKMITGQSLIADAIGLVADQTIIFDELHNYAD